mmetsp:Transcript_18405/g.58412  ORF Transcript_18405/g.58412 Transcript_18405/m.58412 type:complete len:340 (+) Transcript_18405:425-1444(+)
MVADDPARQPLREQLPVPLQVPQEQVQCELRAPVHVPGEARQVHGHLGLRVAFTLLPYACPELPRAGAHCRRWVQRLAVDEHREDVVHNPVHGLLEAKAHIARAAERCVPVAHVDEVHAGGVARDQEHLGAEDAPRLRLEVVRLCIRGVRVLQSGVLGTPEEAKKAPSARMSTLHAKGDAEWRPRWLPKGVVGEEVPAAVLQGRALRHTRTNGLHLCPQTLGAEEVVVVPLHNDRVSALAHGEIPLLPYGPTLASQVQEPKPLAQLRHHRPAVNLGARVAIGVVHNEDLHSLRRVVLRSHQLQRVLEEEEPVVRHDANRDRGPSHRHRWHGRSVGAAKA